VDVPTAAGLALGAVADGLLGDPPRRHPVAGFGTVALALERRLWRDARGSNLLDGGAPFYDTYACADGQYVAVGALEPQFWAVVVQTLGLEDLPEQYDRAGWPELRRRFADRFVQHTRAEWTDVFAGTDACVTPVLAPAEAYRHPHNAARGTFVEVGGIRQPAPAPRFSRTPAAVPHRAGDPVGVEAILSSWPRRS
jgi:alpha-methylacyl-CoA racemase